MSTDATPLPDAAAVTPEDEVTPVLLHGARTPFARFRGALASLSAAELDAAIRRVAKPAGKAPAGKTFAIMGAKGGLGSTTVAVNLATALHKASRQPTLVMDLHLAHGDASVYFGVEPRFSVLDALENIHRLDETYFKGLVTATKAGPDLLASSDRALMGTVDVRGLWRRRRATSLQLPPSSALAQIQLELEELERAEGVRHRWAAAREGSRRP